MCAESATETVSENEALSTSNYGADGPRGGGSLTFTWLLAGVLLGGLVGYLDGYWHAVVDLTMTERKDRQP